MHTADKRVMLAYGIVIWLNKRKPRGLRSRNCKTILVGVRYAVAFVGMIYRLGNCETQFSLCIVAQINNSTQARSRYFQLVAVHKVLKYST